MTLFFNMKTVLCVIISTTNKTLGHFGTTCCSIAVFMICYVQILHTLNWCIDIFPSIYIPSNHALSFTIYVRVRPFRNNFYLYLCRRNPKPVITVMMAYKVSFFHFFPFFFWKISKLNFLSTRAFNLAIIHSPMK